VVCSGRAVLQIDRQALPAGVHLQPFTPAHVQPSESRVENGSWLLVVGFPLDFQDTLHHLPVVRQAAVASAFGMRFQGLRYFFTDTRTHRGTSGAPVVMRDATATPKDSLPWRLLGVHSARLDMAGYGRTIPGAGRIAGSEPRLVCRHPDDVDPGPTQRWRRRILITFFSPGRRKAPRPWAC
jgi:hypothetical protein